MEGKKDREIYNAVVVVTASAPQRMEATILSTTTIVSYSGQICSKLVKWWPGHVET